MPKTGRALLQLPPATAATIEKLGADLAVARLRRKESLKTWAQRMGISVPTLRRLEAGDQRVYIGIVATALWLIQRYSELGTIAAPEHDRGAIEMDVRAAIELGRTRTPLIEHATMTLARRAGTTVAETQVIPLAAANALAIRRFDRQPGRRIHSISAGTAIRAATASGAEPEMAYPELARILRRVGIAQDGINQRDARELFRRMVFNILIDNTDDHEKKHALLVVNPSGNGRLKLAPAYDVLPTNSGQGYQEFICGASGRDSTLENAISQCDAFGLLPKEAAAEVATVIKVVNTWQEHFAQAGVTEQDIESLAERIDGEELLAQRTGFDQAGIQSATTKRKRTSPFRRS